MEKDAKTKMQDLFLQYNFTIIQIVAIFVFVMSLSVHIIAYLKKINHDYGILCL